MGSAGLQARVEIVRDNEFFCVCENELAFASVFAGEKFSAVGAE
jgi:hypothetical protein